MLQYIKKLKYFIHTHSLAFSLICLFLSMVLLSFASVQLYSVFCKATGFGGTTREGLTGSPQLGKRNIVVSFDANIAQDLPWKFFPKQRHIKTTTGHNTLVFYEAENNSTRDIIGTSVYNVTPHKAGQYFVKIQCFCFEEQLLKAHEKVLMPVSFYIDPEFDLDPEMQDVYNITLSYTFFRVQ